MVSGLSPRTIEKHVNLLASIFNKAVENEYLHKSPIATLKRGKAQRKNKIHLLTRQDVEALVKELPPRNQIMVWIGYHSGMRPSEILGLTWEQLDFSKNMIVVDRQLSRDTSFIHDPGGLKTEASVRTIGFTRELQWLILNHVEIYGLGPQGLLLKNRLGGVLRYPDAARLFRGAAIKVGMRPGEGLRQLRHTCVSILISQGVNVKAIQAWVGHSSIVETMDTYGHLFPNSMNDLADRLDAYFEFETTSKSLKNAI